MLHSLTTLKSECERIVNDARNSISNAADGLECDELPTSRAAEILKEVHERLSRLAR
jgi:hypothetical protein